jgi:hypothetical protein
MVLRCVHVASLAVAHVDLDTTHHLLGPLLCSVELFSGGRRQVLLQGHRVCVEDALADSTSLGVRLSVSSSLREASDLIHESEVRALGASLLCGQSLHGCEVTVQATVSIDNHARLGRVVLHSRCRQLLQELHLLRLRQLRPARGSDCGASIRSALCCLARLRIQSTVAGCGRGCIRDRRTLRFRADDSSS